MGDTSLTDIGFVVGATTGGGLLGYAFAWWGKRTAQAAVNVRPSLTEVGIVDALLASHLGDWVYYQYPSVMTVFSVVLLAVAFFVAAVWVVG